jgi:hypothetical protein
MGSRVLFCPPIDPDRGGVRQKAGGAVKVILTYIWSDRRGGWLAGALLVDEIDESGFVLVFKLVSSSPIKPCQPARSSP